MITLGIPEVVSYMLNIVFIAWETKRFFDGREQRRNNANFLNAGYEMSKRLARFAKDEHKQQIEDLSSILRSTAMNEMKLDRNEVGEQTFLSELWDRLKEKLLPSKNEKK